MRETFDVALKHIAGIEGGYVNHPADPGGHTMKGVTLKTYTWYRKRKGLAKPTVADLKRITDAEVAEIFRVQYWNQVRGDELPAGVDYCAGDFAFNSGGGQAVKELQRVLAAMGHNPGGIDGKVGNGTMAALTEALHKQGEDRVINAYQDKRLKFMQSLKNWSTFKNGWTRRVKEVRENGLNIAHGDPMFAPMPGVVPKAEPAEVKQTAIAGVKPALTTVGGTVAASAAAGAQSLLDNAQWSGVEWLPYAIIGFLILSAVGGVLTYLVLKNKPVEEGTV